MHRLSILKVNENPNTNANVSYKDKENIPASKKFEEMKGIIHRAVMKEAGSYSRKHVPVYGWIKMNYPSTIQRSIYMQFEVKENKDLVEESKNLNVLPQISPAFKPKGSKIILKYKGDYGEEIILSEKSNYRKDPKKVNEEILKEVDELIKVDYTQNFMKNYKISDLNFFKNVFTDFEKKKKNFEIDEKVPYNYNHVIDSGSKTYQYELGKKKAFVYLRTDNFQKTCQYIDSNLFFDKKYATIFPKNCILAQEEDKEFTKKCKNIGDISFDESSKESESVKNLSRLPPEYITEEWLKLNLNKRVEMLRLDNCYWLSQDLISKIGRLDENLKELSLKNLEINNAMLTNILRWAKELEVLDITNCFGLNKGVCENIKSCCKNLKSLKLSNLKDIITDGGIEKISSISNLHELDISLCHQVTDKGLIALARNKNHVLTSLDLTGLFKITNQGINQLLAENNNSLNKLKISLLVQKGVDGDICNDIGKCKNLVELDLSGCIRIDVNNLNSVLNLRKIENLNLSGIPQVDDDLAINLVSSNRGLKILRLSNCIEISSSFLDYLINISNSLMLLEINRTPKISDAKIEETVIKKHPNLRIIRATNLEWDLKNIGYKIPLLPKETTELNSKSKDTKNPVNQLKKLIEDNRPKRIWEILKK